jgi:2-amino-4-hydroxy-6-hydroxymethyldihydropteridine diphosphokinase
VKNEIYLSVGSNLGNRVCVLALARSEATSVGLEIERCSGIYEAEPQLLTNHPNFLKCILFVKTTFNALELLEPCQDIERSIGKIQS